MANKLQVTESIIDERLQTRWNVKPIAALRFLALPRYQALIFATALLIIVASRVSHLDEYAFHHDEVWSVWQTFGTPAQIVKWTPYDWAPLYYLVVGGWKELVGIHPVVLRFSSVLFLMLSAALIYRVARRISTQPAALATVVVYSAISFGAYQTVILRGYAMLETLSILMFWLVLRYFYRPTILRWLLLALCMTALYYTHLTSLFIFGLIGLYTLLTTPRQILHWLLPCGIAAILCIPEALQQANLASTLSGAPAMRMAPFPQIIGNLFTMFTGQFSWLWLIVFVLASALLLFRQRLKPKVIALAAWTFLPVLLYFITSISQRFVDPVNTYFLPRYFWWLLLGASLWIGWGLSLLPRAGRAAITVLIAASMFAPLPIQYQDGEPPYLANFTTLAKYARWGDVILLDPPFRQTEGFLWDYYTRVFFPNGIQIVTNPDGYRRVWYVSNPSAQDPETAAAVQRNRIAGEFVGPWNFLFRLYEAPPDVTGIAFENSLRFHGADVIGEAVADEASVRIGEPIRLRLWWSVDRPTKLDYSIGVYLRNKDNSVLAQSDGAPHVPDAPEQMSQWQPGRYYVEERTLIVPDGVITALYPIDMTVYQWWDNVRLNAPGVNADHLLTIQHVFIKSW